MKYFLGLLVTIGLIVLVIVLIIKGMSGDGTTKSQTPLADYASTDAVVQMTVDGPIVAEQDHRAYRITVGNSQVTVEALKGYQYEPIENKVYTNNQESFTNFLRTLDLAGFTRGNPKAKQTDPRGFCPSGDRMTFKILNGATKIQDYWASTCGNQGSFKGNSNQVRSLFNKQVPRTEQKIITQLGI